MRAALVAAALGGCVHAGTPRSVEPDGASVTIYADRRGGPGVAVVAERRVVEIDGDGTMALTDLVGAVELAGLSIEAIDGGAPLGLTSCAVATVAPVPDGTPLRVQRGDGATVVGTAHDGAVAVDDREVHVDPSAVAYVSVPPMQHDGLRCHVGAGPGRRRVRLVYSSPSFAWAPRYRVRVLDPSTVEFAARYLVTAPPSSRGGPVAVTLVAGLPQDQAGAAPVQVWSGPVVLDGPLTLMAPALKRAARAGWVYRGQVVSEDDYRFESRTEVAYELELTPTAADVPGLADITSEQAEVTAMLSPQWRGRVDGQIAPLRVSLAVSDTLTGFRRWRYVASVGDGAIDEILYSVANRGDAPVTVRVEEPLRGRGARIRASAPPDQGALVEDRWERSITVAPGALVRGAVAIEYRELD